jgi:hypothetical protein
MGADQSDTQVIKNSCYSIINQTNTQLVKVISKTSVNVSSTILQQQIATISSQTSGGNTFTGTRIILTDGASLTISQLNDIKVTTGAILNITQNTTLVDSVNDQISNDVMSAVSQDSDLQNKIKASAQLEKYQQSDGEFNAAFDDIAKTIQGVLNLGSNTTKTEDISDTIVSTINQTSSQTTDIRTYVKNKIMNNVKQNTITNCFQDNSAYNITELKDIYISGKSNFDVIQRNFISNYFSCFITSTMTSEDLKNLAAGIINQSSVGAGQGASEKNDLEATLSNIAKTISKSLLDNVQYIIIAIAICVTIGALLLFGTPILLKVLNKKTDMTRKIDNYLSNDGTSNNVPSKNLNNIPGKNISTSIKSYKNMRIGQ